MPRWNTISISGYHMAEAGATPVQEVAFTLANAKEYVRAALASGLAVDEFAPRLSFFFVARTTLLEEVAKFRAARRLWARIMAEEFGAADPRSQMLRFHTQTAGVQLTAQQPEVNLARVTVQALAAVLGGTQSLHTNAYDEAIALPSEKAARLALRTQQVLAHETDLTATADPFAGSYAIESMTDDLEAAARELIARVEDLGGAVAAIERGFQKAEIERLRLPDRPPDRRRRAGRGRGEQVHLGRDEPGEPYQPLRVDPSIEQRPGGAARAAARRPRRRAVAAPDRRPQEGRGGLAERARPAARGAARPGDRGGGRATRCARCGASTSPPKSPDLRRPRRMRGDVSRIDAHRDNCATPADHLAGAIPYRPAPERVPASRRGAEMAAIQRNAEIR